MTPSKPVTHRQHAAGAGQQECLILAGNICIGHQIATLLEGQGKRPHVVHNDKAAYSAVLGGNIGMIVADIDTENLGGLALLAYCHHQRPGIVICAITLADDEQRKRLARNLAGCREFFHLVNGSLRIDTHRGLAAQLVAGRPPAGDRGSIPRQKATGHHDGGQAIGEFGSLSKPGD